MRWQSTYFQDPPPPQTIATEKGGGGEHSRRERGNHSTHNLHPWGALGYTHGRALVFIFTSFVELCTSPNIQTSLIPPVGKEAGTRATLTDFWSWSGFTDQSTGVRACHSYFSLSNESLRSSVIKSPLLCKGCFNKQYVETRNVFPPSLPMRLITYW